jgi:uncharacterized iron-regulated protein
VRQPRPAATLATLAAGAALSGCAAAPPGHASANAAHEARFDPTGLEERIFETASGSELSRDAMLERMARADVVYLGEKHDNARQHRLQVEVIEAMLVRGRRPSIAFEVFSREQTSVLMGYAEGGGPAEPDQLEAGIRQALGWADPRRDESWAFYGPLLDLARREHLHAAGIDLPRALRLRMARAGLEGLTGVERSLLAPSDFEDEAYAELVKGWLRESHCGFGDDAYLSRLYRTWLERNEAMAAAIDVTLADHEDQPVVVIVGSGHVRHGMGVPERLARRRPGIEQVNLAFVETRSGMRDAAAYFAPAEIGGRAFGPRHDYVWFTEPAGPFTDPCAAAHAPPGKSQR